MERHIEVRQMAQIPSSGLYDLPVELLHEVQIYSAWHALPLASKHLYCAFKSAPSSICAEYLISCYLQAAEQAPRRSQAGVINKALRYPLCTQAVLEIMLRMPSCPPVHVALRTQLPKRLFRSLTARSQRRFLDTSEPLPLLQFLFTNSKIPPPDPDSNDGYALTNAVAAGFIPLVQFLLDNGASPRHKNGLAVRAAIRRKDLALVKMLVEPDNTPCTVTDHGQQFQARGSSRGVSGRRRTREDNVVIGKGVKRRKLEDRIAVDLDMLKTAVSCNAQDIVAYFVNEKSCMPDMQTLRLMQSIGM